MTPLRIALVVHGRFYVFEMARELIRQGHDVALFTNYPKSVCERFGVPRTRVFTLLLHGIFSRILMRLFPFARAGFVERWNNTLFGRWAARSVPRHGPWDVVMCMSGIAEDLFSALQGTATLRVVERASVHIREQQRILAREQQVGGGRVEKPSDWIVAREEREYQMADLIHVNSQHVLDSFIEAGVPAGKIDLYTLGVDVSAFEPAPGVIDERCRRIAAGGPLRVICAGLFCRRKGSRTWDQLIRELNPPGTYRFVGTVCADAVTHARSLSRVAEFRAPVPQARLPDEYAWADLFILPTLEDGFPAVIAQALASGLPVISTTTCGSSVLVEEGLTGWVIPPDQPELLAERLRWLDRNRQELVAAVRRLSERQFSRDWADVARDFIRSVSSRRESRTETCETR